MLKATAASASARRRNRPQIAPKEIEVNTQQPESPLDPLRRVLVPIEKRTANGTIVFRTTDKEVYFRHTDGSIRRASLKVNGKEARKARRLSRLLSA
jgi:hypothetical protein